MTFSLILNALQNTARLQTPPAKVGRPVKTYPNLLTEDTSVQLADLPNAVDNRELWREAVNSVRATRPI